ncbi:MAG: hypothetical protein IPK13_24120 [Deltaproteobacteria bacterium]|nr:hypothetical protein [Deltaproteobacteria bacterium]
MAVLFRQVHRGQTVEVRSAGQTRRLYVDGVLHTQHRPNAGLSGGVWDQLALSGLLAPPRSIRRVLVLGLGGGAVIPILERFIKPEEIVAIELDPLRPKLARRFFGLRTSHRLRIIEGDAVAWVRAQAQAQARAGAQARAHGSQRFQMIIDDISTENGGLPVRAVRADAAWIRSLSALLDEQGILTLNAFSRAELSACPLFRRRAQRSRQFPAVYRLEDARFENAIGVASSWPRTPNAFWRRVRDTVGSPLSFRITRLR